MGLQADDGQTTRTLALANSVTGAVLASETLLERRKLCEAIRVTREQNRMMGAPEAGLSD